MSDAAARRPAQVPRFPLATVYDRHPEDKPEWSDDKEK